MGKCEAKDKKRIASRPVEAWIGEAQDHDQETEVGVAQQWRPEDGCVLVLARTDDDIEVLAELVTLCQSQSLPKETSCN